MTTIRILNERSPHLWRLWIQVSCVRGVDPWRVGLMRKGRANDLLLYLLALWNRKLLKKKKKNLP